MMRFTNFIVIALFATLLASCKSSFRISVKEPAVIKMPDSVKKIGVINNINEENSPEKIISTVLGAEQINGNVVAGERAIDGILQALNDSGFLTGEFLEGDSLYSSEGQLDWQFLDTMAKSRGFHAYIELSELRSVSPVGGTIAANATGQRSTKIDGTLYINVHIVESGQNFTRYSAHETVQIPLSGTTTILDILNDIQRKREYYRTLGFRLGREAGSYVYPNWVWVSRKYYNKGTRSLKAAKDMIRYGNWDIAEQTLLPDEHYGKLKKRGRVLFNLALVKEGQGEIDKAIEYAERAASECYNKEANEYLVKLRQRKRLMEQL